MQKTIYILGAGGMARETYLIYKDLNQEGSVSGFISQLSDQENSDIAGLKVYSEQFLSELQTKPLVIGAVGTPLRQNWIIALLDKGLEFDTVIAPSANIRQNKVGKGSIICSFVNLTCDITIGEHTIINTGCNIHHDCIIGNFVTISPGTNIAGKVEIGDGSFVGIGTTIKDGVKIGKNAYIGAGAVVVSDIPDGVLAYGVPAKSVRSITKEDWKNLI